MIRQGGVWAHAATTGRVPWARTPWDERVTGLLARWKGTPYASGNAVEGRGADCIRFVTAVLDDLQGRPRVGYERLPLDTALHAPTVARRALRAILARYRPTERVWRGAYEAGDVIVCHVPANDAPTHAAICSAEPGMLMHATERGIEPVHLRDLRGVARHYRVSDRAARWAA